jgi:hypothetical protein
VLFVVEARIAGQLREVAVNSGEEPQAASRHYCGELSLTSSEEGALTAVIGMLCQRRRT